MIYNETHELQSTDYSIEPVVVEEFSLYRRQFANYILSIHFEGYRGWKGYFAQEIRPEDIAKAIKVYQDVLKVDSLFALDGKAIWIKWGGKIDVLHEYTNVPYIGDPLRNLWIKNTEVPDEHFLDKHKQKEG